jgi:hypothetical protein
VFNATFVVGGTNNHGPFSWSAWTVDVLGGILIASRFGHEASYGVEVSQIIDSDFVRYYSANRSVSVDWSKVPAPNIVAIGSAGVNLLAYRYNATGIIPFHFVWNESTAYIYSDLTGNKYTSGWGYDYAVIALVKDPDTNKTVLLVFGVTGKGSQAASIVIAHYNYYSNLLKGKAVIIKWQDANGDNIVDSYDNFTLVETAP